MDDIEILRPMNNKKFAGFPDFGAAALALYFPLVFPTPLLTVVHRWSSLVSHHCDDHSQDDEERKRKLGRCGSRVGGFY